MAKKYTQNQIKLIKNRSVFIDTNILLYLFWSIGDVSWGDDYTTIFKNLRSNKIPICTDVTVISEFINRCIKINYNIHLVNNPDLKFKEFRDSNSGQVLLNDINTIITDIVEKFDIVGYTYCKDDVIKLIHQQNLDFNDKLIVKLCQHHNLVLLTNDIDFKSSEIDILSANPRFFN